MGPLQRLRFRQSIRRDSEEQLVNLSLDAGLTEAEVDTIVQQKGIGGLLDKLLAVITDPRIKQILDTIKALLSLV